MAMVIFFILIKFSAKDTVFLKYLTTFVPQKRVVTFEELKNPKCRSYCIKKMVEA